MLKSKISVAIVAALASTAMHAQENEENTPRAQIETIEVTATKRTESIQDVPVSVTALNGNALENLGVDSFDDYVEFLPNVTFQGTGPGQNEIYIRGAATTQTNISVSSVQALQPSVALYLDEQPISMQGRNLDVFATDMERIEVLPGPQGTLFGASSQSGTVRLITAKPDHSGFSAGVDTDLAFTNGGENSTTVETFFNFAVTDDLAVRVAAYSAQQGGWIDNILNAPGEGGYIGSAVVIDRISGGVLSDPANTPVDSPVNDALVEEDFNDALYTLNKLDLVYTGGYLDRDINSLIDYTGYTNGGLFSAYYVCNHYEAATPADERCLDPTKFYTEETETKRTTHEFRINTDVDNVWRLTAGVFYDTQDVNTIGQFKIGNTDLGFFSDLARTTVGQEGINSNGGPFPSEVSFINDVRHAIDQIAVFGQVEYDLTDTLTASVGARWYQIDDIYKGSTSTVDVTRRIRAFGTLDADELAAVGLDPVAVNEAINSGQLEVDLLDDNGVLTVDDTIFKFSLDWKANDDVLLFATYSEGFRPPVTNRVGGGLATNQEGAFTDFRIPVYSLTDTLDNFELGMKGDFLDGILRVNATAFFSEITDLQTSRFDPTNISFLVFTDNVGDAEIRGLDADITWLANDNLIIDAAFSLLDTELTSINPELQGIALPVGAELPYSAPFSGNLRAQYFYELPQGLNGYVNASISYTGCNKPCLWNRFGSAYRKRSGCV